MRIMSSISDGQTCPSVLMSFRWIADAVGQEEFLSVMDAEVNKLVPVSRWYFISQELSGLGDTPRTLAYKHESGLENMVETYLTHFRRNDPINKVMPRVSDDKVLAMTVTPDDINDMEYRDRYLKRANVVERVSLIHRATKSMELMSVTRRDDQGPMSDDAMNRLSHFSRLAFPLLRKHLSLTEKKSLLAVADIEALFRTRFPELSARECEVCARASMSMTSKYIARDLGISTETVSTYRKRAYQRLGVNSAASLARLITQ